MLLQMHFHLDLDSLNEVVPLEVLPDEMRGQAGALRDLQVAQVSKLRDCSLWFTMKHSNDTFASCSRKITASLSKLSMITSSQDQKIVSPTA